MIDPYRRLLTIPGARGFVAAAFVGRASMPMIGLGIVLLVSAVTGSYGLAGTVAATASLAMAAAAPRIGRVVDRYGQRRVLPVLAAVHGSGLASLMACAEAGGPVWALFLAATVTGCAYPPIGALVRTRWSHLLGASPRLEVAFSLESVLDEVIFVGGPIVVTVLATQVHRLAGLTVAGALTVAGSLAFALQRRTEPPARRIRAPGSAGLAVAARGLFVMVAVFLAMGAAFGALEVSIVAFSEEEGLRGAAGLVLGLQAAGSLLAGLAYGARAWRTPIDRRFRFGVLGFAAGLAPLAAMPNVPALAVVAFVGGMAISPTLIPAFGLVNRLVPAHTRNEGFAWVTTAIGVGLAVGSPVTGRVVDAAGGRAALLVPFAAALLAAAAGMLTAFRGEESGVDGVPRSARDT